MVYTKRIVCLAKSTKPGGRCVAGIEYEAGEVGDWIRPVAHRLGSPVPLGDLVLESGEELELLDIVQIKFLEHYPIGCQVENHVYDRTRSWKKVGKLEPDRLHELADWPTDLWGMGTGWGNDRVPLAQSEQLGSSLALLKLYHPSVRVKEWKVNDISARAEFHFRDVWYSFKITDPIEKQRFLAMGEGSYTLRGDVYLCASLGEPIRGNRHKLAAGLFEIEKLT